MDSLYPNNFLYNYDNINTPQYDNIIVNNDGKTLQIETETMDYISNYINDKFELKEFPFLKTEKNILEFFYDNEQECLDIIDSNFYDNKEMNNFFRNFTFNSIEEKYLNNNDISLIKTNIKNELENILKEFRKKIDFNLDDLYDIFLHKFKTTKIPQFIEKKVIEEIKSIQLINQLNNSKNNKDYIEDEEIDEKKEIIITYYTQFVNGEAEPFEYYDKKLLFDILIYSNLEDIYKNETIKEIFINNYSEIAISFKYYNNNKEFKNLIDNKKEDIHYITNKLIDTFNKYEINDLHLYIIASFYFLIMNVMKDINDWNNKDIGLNNEIININNPLFNKILRNILYNFDKYCPNDIYTFEIYIILINHLNEYIIINGNGEKENKKYNINDMENTIKKSFFFGIYEDFTLLIKKIKETELLGNASDSNKFALIPLSKNRNSNEITILVSGFLSQNEDIKTWKQFFNYDKNNTNYYLFRWPSSDIMTLIFQTYLFWLNSADLFLKSRKKAKYSGKILALFLACNEEFNNCQINLVGYSLGCQVIKYCLKKLEFIKGHRDMINNVLFMGGATSIKEIKSNIWKNIFHKNVRGRIINCYSKYDSVLKYLFRICVGKNPIGLQKIDLKIGNNNFIENYDFTDWKLGHLEYRYKFSEILKRINYFN